MNKYFASLEKKETCANLEARAEDWKNTVTQNGYLSKLKALYAAYHGAYYTNTTESHQIVFGGEQGELSQIAINHFRNISQHMLVMVTSNRPAVEARATNTDYRSQRQTILANSILEYYLREKKLEIYLKQATEYAIVYGSGYIVMSWNATKGEMVDYIEEIKTPVYEGDIEFESLNPWDVIFDTTKENSQNHDWYLVRRYKNRFDLIAKYPELEKQIKAQKSKGENNFTFSRINDQTDDIEVLEFYHRRTEALPDGRYMLFCSSDCVLEDSPLPYRVMPVFRISPSLIHGTSFGYSPMFDILPIQEQINALYSTVATNQNSFGVQNILNPRGNEISVNQLAGGLNILEYNMQIGKPEPLQLTSTPQEIFAFINQLERVAETISGVNGVSRGDPSASLKSGTSLALVQSMALQFMSGLQASYVQLIESTGTAIVKMLQDFASTPRLIAIAGKKNRQFMKEFSSSDLDQISRVICSVANPLSKTTAGKVQMAQELIQYGQITPQQYISLIQTGSLEDMTEDLTNENLLMRSENESMIDGQSPLMTVTDSHQKHIEYHRSILFDPDLRTDARVVAAVTTHIQEHIDALRTTDPGLLMILNQQPLPQAPPTAQIDEMLTPPMGNDPTGLVGGTLVGPGLEQGATLPNMPEVPPGVLMNPELQQQSLGNVKGMSDE
jgi:hypothetical protein